ncbi:hypothetical protein GCM10009765_80460 [Fodinicola feengrottensis]|uniref:GH18 domain-containing protein n=2 Tax=Fodinicola feengrottensis TaxID=435914 RepID=A0ABN2J8F4_9ACTN
MLALAALTAGCVPEIPAIDRTDAFAPFYEVDSTHPPNLPALAKQSGTRWFTLGFVVGSDDCQPTWDSDGGPYANPTLAASIRDFRSGGGNVRLSFGGADGTELAQACDTVDDLAAAYQKVISAYGITAVDFDIEGDALKDDEANQRRIQAIKKLQAKAELRVSFTLPTGRTGLATRGVSLLQQAATANIAVDAVNIMAMDYGGAESDMGQVAVDAATATQADLARIWPAKSPAQTWRMVAVTVMIGVNDVPSEVFGTGDAGVLVSAAQKNHYGWLSFWSMNRDLPCPTGQPANAAPACSGVSQRPYAYSVLFGHYRG